MSLRKKGLVLAMEDDVKVLLKKIDFSNYDILIGVAKGGLPLLVKLANKTEKDYQIIKAYSYEGRERRQLVVEGYYPLRYNSNCRVLLIDDLVDSGKTLKIIRENLLGRGAASVETLTLFYKPQSVVVPEWYLHGVENWQWIKFPWEG